MEPATQLSLYRQMVEIRTYEEAILREYHADKTPVFDIGAIDQGRAPSRKMLFIGRAPMPAAAARWLRAAPGAI